MTSPISFSGIASGIDSSAIISSLVGVAKIPISRLQSKQSDNSAQSKKLSDIKTKLATLQTAAQALDTKNEALGNKVSSSNTNVFDAQGVGGAAMGSFKVDVSSVAKAERTYSDTVSSSSEAGLFGTGTLTVQVGTGSAVDISVDSSDTLSSLAGKINASGAAVTAGVFYDGSSYRLQVTGQQTGAANAITFGESSGLTLGLSSADNEKQTASDAVLTIDGLEVRSASNSVTGAVPGVTLHIVDVGSSVVKVDRDGDGLKTKLGTFVSAYNDVMKTLNAEFSYTGATKGGDSLMGDSSLQSLQNTLRGLVSRTASNGDSKLTMLAAIGVSTARDGTLSIDDTKFSKAVNSDYDGIASLLAGQTDRTGLMSQISSGLDPFAGTGGILRTKIDDLSTRNRRINDQIGSMQLRIDKYQDTLKAQYTALEQTISGLQGQSNAMASVLSRS
jgi:flagellar hook-associated protein 2